MPKSWYSFSCHVKCDLSHSITFRLFSLTRNYSGRPSAGRNVDPISQRVLTYDKDSEAAISGELSPMKLYSEDLSFIKKN